MFSKSAHQHTRHLLQSENTTNSLLRNLQSVLQELSRVEHAVCVSPKESTKQVLISTFNSFASTFSAFLSLYPKTHTFSDTETTYVLNKSFDTMRLCLINHSLHPRDIFLLISPIMDNLVNRFLHPKSNIRLTSSFVLLTLSLVEADSATALFLLHWNLPTLILRSLHDAGDFQWQTSFLVNAKFILSHIDPKYIFLFKFRIAFVREGIENLTDALLCSANDTQRKMTSSFLTSTFVTNTNPP